jgi:sugar phosphate isomerase/epimerase
MNTRRRFLRQTAATALGALSASALAQQLKPQGESISFGLCTYMLGAEWDIPTIIKNLSDLKMGGVELRVDHAHKVSPMLKNDERAKVRAQFEDSGVELVGLGTNWKFDSPDKEELRTNLGEAKMWIQLSHDIGGSGVKVKPDRFWPDVPREKTIEQIGKALNELGEYAAGFGQQIRLEVHGQCQELPTIKAIMDIATDPSVAICWNSNKADLAGEGLEGNFNLVRKRWGQTCHIHELESPDYPHQELLNLLVKSKWEGWLLMENASKPADRVAAMAHERKLFDEMLKKAQA